MRKVYFLNKHKNSKTDIIYIHKIMEEAGADMGQDHDNRLKTNNFDYHFKFNTSDKSFYADSWTSAPVENDGINFEKSAEWFIKFIKNGFKEPNEVKVIDNSNELSIETFLDKQLKTINN